MYTCNLVRERQSEDEIYIDTFMVDDNVTNPEEALRNAVNEFLETDDGKKAVMYSCNDFNWGDAVISVPEEIWNKHGIYFSCSTPCTIRVNQDEVLCDEADLKLI